MLEGTVLFETNKARPHGAYKKCKAVENVWLFGAGGHGLFELGWSEEVSVEVTLK